MRGDDDGGEFNYGGGDGEEGDFAEGDGDDTIDFGDGEGFGEEGDDDDNNDEEVDEEDDESDDDAAGEAGGGFIEEGDDVEDDDTIKEGNGEEDGGEIAVGDGDNFMLQMIQLGPVSRLEWKGLHCERFPLTIDHEYIKIWFEFKFRTFGHNMSWYGISRTDGTKCGRLIGRCYSKVVGKDWDDAGIVYP